MGWVTQRHIMRTAIYIHFKITQPSMFVSSRVSLSKKFYNETFGSVDMRENRWEHVTGFCADRDEVGQLKTHVSTHSATCPSSYVSNNLCTQRANTKKQTRNLVSVGSFTIKHIFQLFFFQTPSHTRGCVKLSSKHGPAQMFPYSTNKNCTFTLRQSATKTKSTHFSTQSKSPVFGLK